ncbi:TIR domain-containing protein [Solirubrobacter taibaiensis]|nr:TIR domain-containing protein [Solirubrobacter taibaiensis]
MSSYTYDVALSYAGEDREVARAIARIAQANEVRLYFDEHYLWETWGTNLLDDLGRIYSDESRYCLLLISEDYCAKPYTNFERQMALSRALESGEEYVLPVRLDDAWPPGLPETTAYFDLRVRSTAELGEWLVRKVNGADWVLRSADSAPVPPLPRPVPVLPPAAPAPAAQSIAFADVTVADECRAWQDDENPRPGTWSAEPARWTFRGGVGYYEDPIFDITVLNRATVPRLLTMVGIEVLSAGYASHLLLGGGGQTVHLHRTYELPLPDVWAALAAHLDADAKYPYGPMAMSERAGTRLADPILIGPGEAYRFGLHLLDYTSLCPTEVELVFWAQTDEGIDCSPRARLGYVIGGDIEPTMRFKRLLEGQPAVADRELATVHRRSL